MILEKTKVVIVDDEENDVEKLIKKLKIDGIGYTHYSGALNEFPRSPLSGIRTLFLDFVLGTDGQPDKTKISMLMSAVKKIISKDNGPFVIVAWTKHNDLFDLFKVEVMKDIDFPKPFLLIDLDKNSCMNSMRKITKEFKNKISNENVLKLLLLWENISRNALCEVLNNLCEISKPISGNNPDFEEYQKQWNDEMEKHIYKIAESSLGSGNVKANNELISTILLLLNSYFYDCLEKEIKDNKLAHKKIAKKITDHSSFQYNDQQKAMMNSIFLINNKLTNLKIQPGTTYLYSHVTRKIKCSNRECYLGKGLATKHEIISEYFEGKLSQYTGKKSLLRDTIPILIEVTPECDYVQRNWKNCRMLLGVLWPEAHAKKMKKKGDKFYKAIPIIFNRKTYFITFHSHFNFSIPPGIFNKLMPIFKARKELLVDIQQWYSKQISRPGKTEF